MSAKRITDTKLSQYFLKMSKNEKEIPYMTVISKTTGVSHATISRYARRKGFYNFAEMRATFNKTGNTLFAKIDENGLDEMFGDKDVKIVTSVATHIIGEFLKMRMEYKGGKLEIADKDTVWKDDDFTLFVTLSGESEKVRKYMKNCKGSMAVLSTTKMHGISPDIKQVILSDYQYEIRNSFDTANTIIKIMNWLNEIINIKHIQMDNKK